MSMKVMPVLNLDCCQGIKQNATTAGSWIKKTAYSVGSFFSDLGHRVAAFARTYLEKSKTFTKEHKQGVIIGALVVLAAVAAALIHGIYSKATNPNQPTPVPTPANTNP